MAKGSPKPKFTLDMPPPAEPFEGFSDKTFKFLHGLGKNNNKAWFEAHRSDYETYLREPSKVLVTIMAQHFASEKIPLIADQKRSLFRINRDIRFSKDKSPYKTHIGIVFPTPDLGEDEWAGMYFSFEPNGASDITTYVGGGIYSPSPAFLKSVRNRIATNFKQFEKLNSAKSFLSEYPKGIGGESLVRMPKGYDEDHPAAKFLKQKEFLYSSSLIKKDLLSPKLPDILLKKFEAALPMLQFLSGKG
jgi:uncharacterized protein (TIGR02453 family)